MQVSNRDVANTLATYYNYVSAWELALQREYGNSCISRQAFLQRQQSLNAFKTLRGGRPNSGELTSSYCRGLLTRRSMQLPVDKFPFLASTVNLWLPVQAYYAIHGMGISVLVALGHHVPRNHRAFRAAFAQSLSRYFPFPFNALCKGGPRANDFTFSHLNISAKDVSGQSNLAIPRSSNADLLVGKSLSTTRRNLLEEQFDLARHRGVKPDRSYRQLTSQERSQIADRVASTCIVDLLYRMRVRSNYEDPDMYLEAFDYPEQASAHYLAFTHLVTMLVEALRAVVKRAIGPQAMAGLEDRLKGL